LEIEALACLDAVQQHGADFNWFVRKNMPQHTRTQRPAGETMLPASLAALVAMDWKNSTEIWWVSHDETALWMGLAAANYISHYTDKKPRILWLDWKARYRINLTLLAKNFSAALHQEGSVRKPFTALESFLLVLFEDMPTLLTRYTFDCFRMIWHGQCSFMTMRGRQVLEGQSDMLIKLDNGKYELKDEVYIQVRIAMGQMLLLDAHGEALVETMPSQVETFAVAGAVYPPLLWSEGLFNNGAGFQVDDLHFFPLMEQTLPLAHQAMWWFEILRYVVFSTLGLKLKDPETLVEMDVTLAQALRPLQIPRPFCQWSERLLNDHRDILRSDIILFSGDRYCTATLQFTGNFEAPPLSYHRCLSSSGRYGENNHLNSSSGSWGSPTVTSSPTSSSSPFGTHAHRSAGPHF
jgi:hypothetical protein